MKTIKNAFQFLAYLIALILVWCLLLLVIGQINQCTHDYEQKRCKLILTK